MRCVSKSAERQTDIEIAIRNGIAQIYLRSGHREVSEETETVRGNATVRVTETHWECDEAYMECADSEAPDAEEVAEDFDGWYEYVGDWEPEKQKTLAQLQADVEYIAAVSGIELEV